MGRKPVMAIDIGSNAMRMKMFDGSTLLARRRFKVRLGFDVFHDGTVHENTLNQLIHALGECHLLAEQFNVQQVRLVATSALRNAKNARQSIRTVRNETGYLIDLIDGETEAELVFEAVKNKVAEASGTCLLIDIGGGSVELIGVRNGSIRQLKSFPAGTVRTLFQAEAEGWKQQDIEVMMNDLLGDCLNDWKKKSCCRLAVGTGGNFRAIGKASGHLNRGSRSVACDRLVPFLDELIDKSEKQRMKSYGFSANRAAVSMPAALAIRLIAKSLKLERIYLPKVGLVDGVLLNMQSNGHGLKRPMPC